MQDLLDQQHAPMQRLLVLCGVQEPGNLGTLTRTAAALGWDAVAMTHDCCDPFNEKALRAARGASLRVRACAALCCAWECMRHPEPAVILHWTDNKLCYRAAFTPIARQCAACELKMQAGVLTGI